MGVEKAPPNEFISYHIYQEFLPQWPLFERTEIINRIMGEAGKEISPRGATEPQSYIAQRLKINKQNVMEFKLNDNHCTSPSHRNLTMIQKNLAFFSFLGASVDSIC